MSTTESFPFELGTGERLIWSGAPRRVVAVSVSGIIQTAPV